MPKYHTKNTTGSFSLGEDKFFFKVLDKHNFVRERDGYKSISEYYPVPKLIHASSSIKKDGLLIFEYEDTIGKNCGLLVDQFAHKKKLDKDFINILNLYRDIFLKTLKKADGAAVDIFFKDRVKTRLSEYYESSFIEKNVNFKLNGVQISGNLTEILENINKFFDNKNTKWCVMSQCDPNDLNIGTKPIIFDYTAGGNVPLMAEFATLFWYQLAQGSYLSLKYNREAFVEHRDIYKSMDFVELDGGKLKHVPSHLRLAFIKEYINHVIKPCFERIPFADRSSWYEEFKNYLAMKIIGVFDVSKMSKKDQLLSIGYLHLFYNTKVIDFDDLVSLINIKN